MAWRIVRQPNGRLARWSDVVEWFTDYDMTEYQAFKRCREEMGKQDAEEKVRRAVEDHEPWMVGVKGDGLSRWRDCLKDMTLNHMVEKAVICIKEMGFPEWEAWVRENAYKREE